jgi:hypothetical protein
MFEKYRAAKIYTDESYAQIQIKNGAGTAQ